MKRKVRLSIFSSIITVGCFALFIAIFVVVPQGWFFCFYGIVVVGVSLLGLYYSPMSVRVTDTAIEVVRSLQIKEFLFADVKEVRLYSPTIGVFRICGSGGFGKGNSGGILLITARLPIAFWWY